MVDCPGKLLFHKNLACNDMRFSRLLSQKMSRYLVLRYYYYRCHHQFQGAETEEFIVISQILSLEIECERNGISEMSKKTKQNIISKVLTVSH